MRDEQRTQLENFVNLVNLIELAFPAATSFLVKDDQRLALTLQVTNIQEHTVKELLVPRMSDWQTYDWSDDTLTMNCTFPPEMWPEMLPVFFLRITAEKDNEIPLGITADLCRKIARNEITPVDYVNWVESYGKPTEATEEK